jgi:glucose/arabinose dehydrogenase
MRLTTSVTRLAACGVIELRQRIREVRQGPDGYLYLLTDEDDGALLRIETGP